MNNKVNDIIEKIQNNYNISIDLCTKLEEFNIPIDILENVKQLNTIEIQYILNYNFCVQECIVCDLSNKQKEIIKNYINNSN